MTRPAILLFLAAALAVPQAQAEIVLKPVPDVHLFASPDPLTQSVLRTQLADPRSGGVVSAVLHRPKAGSAAAARVDYEGSATPADSLGLPTPAVARGPIAVGASDLRDAPGAAAKPGKAAVNSRFLKRSIAASQLLSVVEAMRSKANAQRVSKSAP
ncbi:MAG: hypothetical protein HY553_21440 [Elusimicrobia bacterium]|nr:hypothetical protein [Elusimicrobiota bacterium]